MKTLFSHKILIKTIVLLTIISLTYGCTSNTSYFEQMLKNENAHLRGVTIGMTLNEVKAIEQDVTEFLEDDMPDYLYYDIELDMGNSYTVSYDFFQKKLYEIEMAGYFETKESANITYKAFEKHFNQHFGKGIVANDGFKVWKTNSSITKGKVEIALINDSDHYGSVSIIVSDMEN